ncbi:DUF4232 domain-containing protein [Acetobacteraceae bacterium]|nr:DUF4232 domain-containing protein [Acetobacteraceae bacterium]
MPTSLKEYFFLLPLFCGPTFLPTSAQAKSLAAACTSEQIEIAFLPEEGPYNGMSQDKATLFFRNISHQDCTLPEIPKIQFLDKDNHVLSVAHEKPEEYHFRRFPHQEKERPYLLQKKENKGQSKAYTILFWISAPVYATGVCLSPQSIEVLLPHMKWQVPFKNTICGVTTTPWYQESHLKEGSNLNRKYISALKGEPESPKDFREDEKPIEASSPGQSEPPTA